MFPSTGIAQIWKCAHSPTAVRADRSLMSSLLVTDRNVPLHHFRRVNSDVLPGCGCRSYAPGHNCHVIQATRANSGPTSWFPATVTALEHEDATVEYDDGTTCRLWRHGGFDQRVHVGTALLVCECWSLVSLAASSGRDQLSVAVRDPRWRKSGLPEDRPRPWRASIVSNASGEWFEVLRDMD